MKREDIAFAVVGAGVTFAATAILGYWDVGVAWLESIVGGLIAFTVSVAARQMSE